MWNWVKKEKEIDEQHTSRIVSVCDIIWMLTWDWLVGRLSVERDLAKDRDPVRTLLLLRAISVRRNTRDMYAELSPRTPKAVRRNLAGVTCKLINYHFYQHSSELKLCKIIKYWAKNIQLKIYYKCKLLDKILHMYLYIVIFI